MFRLISRIEKLETMDRFLANDDGVQILYVSEKVSRKDVRDGFNS